MVFSLKKAIKSLAQKCSKSAPVRFIRNKMPKKSIEQSEAVPESKISETESQEENIILSKIENSVQETKVSELCAGIPNETVEDCPSKKRRNNKFGLQNANKCL